MASNSSGFTKQQRRRRRRIVRILTTIAMAVLAVVILMSAMRIKTLNAFEGEYRRPVDLTERITANIAVWLQDVEGADVDTEWVRSRTEPMYIYSDLSFDRNGLRKGTYTEALDETSYSECEDKAYSLCADCLRELIIKRLVITGYAESIDNDTADRLVTDALGMTLDNYIKNAGVKIMPDHDELSGEIVRSGEYRIKGNFVSWERAGTTVTDEFRRAGDSLIIVEPEYVYRRLQ